MPDPFKMKGILNFGAIRFVSQRLYYQSITVILETLDYHLKY